LICVDFQGKRERTKEDGALIKTWRELKVSEELKRFVQTRKGEKKVITVVVGIEARQTKMNEFTN
jgi:hypothetical protein